jgi:osmoprotectant transport system substrate-binding protein
MRSHRRHLLVAASAGLALVAAACGSSSKSSSSTGTTGGAAKGSVTIAAFNFPESSILADIYAGALEKDGFKVTVRPNLGSREVLAPALEKGDIDMYPGYAATDLEFFTGSAGEATADAAATTDKLRQRLASKGLTALDPAPAVDTNAFAVTKATATKYNLKRLSDLAPVASQLVLGGPPECPTRPYCGKGLESKYGLKFKSFQPVGLGPVANAALQKGDVDITEVLSTDGSARDQFVLLDDDKQLQNADNVVPVIRAQAATEQARTVLNKVSAALTTTDLAELDKRSDVDKEDPEVLANDWLKKHGFTK